MYNTFEEVAHRYAAALFAAGQETGDLDSVDKAMTSFGNLFAQSEDMKRVVRTPGISPEEYSAVFTAICQKIGAGETIYNFTQLLCTRKRVFLMPSIVEHFQEMMSAMRGEVQATVISAKPLNKDQITALTKSLQPFAGQGKVLVHQRVDEQLIGGFKVLMDTRLIDLTVKSRLEAIQSSLIA